MNDKIALAWSDLTVCSRSNSNAILNNISGNLSVGSFNALMGSSGSGKSTLLKCLNGSEKYCLSQTSQIFVRKDINNRLHIHLPRSRAQNNERTDCRDSAHIFF